VWSRWLDIGQARFCGLKDRDAVAVSKRAKEDRGQYSAILTEQPGNKGFITWLKKHNILAGNSG